MERHGEEQERPMEEHPEKRFGEEKAYNNFKICCIVYLLIVVINAIIVLDIPTWAFAVICVLIYIFWMKVNQWRIEAAERQLVEDRRALERDLAEWAVARTRTVHRLHNIADNINRSRRNCNIAKTSVNCLVLLADVANLIGRFYGYTLPVNANNIRRVLRVAEYATEYVADAVADVRSSRGAQEADRVLEQDDEHTFRRLREQRIRYRQSMTRYMALAKSIDNAILRFTTDGISTEVFIEIGNIFTSRMRVAAFDDNNKVKNIISKVVTFGKVLSPYVVADRHQGKKDALLNVLTMIIDAATIYERFNEIQSGSPDEAADKIRAIARDLEEQIPTVEGVVLEVLLGVANENNLRIMGNL